MDRAPREREKTQNQFVIQKPDHVLYVAHLSTHSVLTPNLEAATKLIDWTNAPKTIHNLSTESLTFSVRAHLRTNESHSTGKAGIKST